jgi:hypothetical protein
MSEKQKLAEQEREAAEKEHQPGSDGREPTEGRWVAEPRDPDPTLEGDGVTRMRTEKRDESRNPQNRQKGPDEDNIEEKVVEAGVEDTKLDIDTDIELMPHKLPGT